MWVKGAYIMFDISCLKLLSVDFKLLRLCLKPLIWAPSCSQSGSTGVSIICILVDKWQKQLYAVTLKTLNKNRKSGYNKIDIDILADCMSLKSA